MRYSLQKLPEPGARGAALNASSNTFERTFATDSFPFDTSDLTRKARGRLDQFKVLVEEDRATAQDAKACLKELRQHLGHLPRPQQRKECIELQAGTQVMLRLISKAMQDPESLYLDKDMALDLCWFGLPESLQDYIFAWAERDLQQPYVEYDKYAPHRSPPHRVDMLFQGLLNAHLAWHPESPNSALACFKSFDERFGHHKWDRRNFRIYVAGVMVLHLHLQRDSCPKSDPQLFEYFADHATEVRPAPAHAELKARLLLFHPTHPQAQPLLQCMDQYGWYLEQIWSAKPSAVNAWSRHLMRAAYILRRSSGSADADEIERMVETRGKPVWSSRKIIWQEFSRDPKLAVLNNHGAE